MTAVRDTLPGRQRKVLIVSPSFPPLNTADMQRVRMSLPHYQRCGWEPIVLTVASKNQEGVREHDLLQTVPRGIRIEHCGALSPRLCGALGLRNLGIRAWWHLLFTGARLIRTEKVDLVFISTTYFFTFTLGRVWKRWLGTPYVIDLQDPWRTDNYERAGAAKPPGGWKYQLARLQARILEPWAFRRLSGMISVSPDYLHDLGTRYTWFRRIQAATIPFGVSEDDVRLARGGRPTAAPDGELVRLVYTGAAGPITPKAANLMLGALRQFRDANPAHAARLRMEFHGTSYATGERAVATLLPIAEKHGVADLVSEHAERLGYLETLRVQAEASALLLPGSIDPAYSPSKLYTYFLARRPMLALVLQGSVLEKLVDELSCATIVAWGGGRDDSDVREALCRFFAEACAGFPPGTLRMPNEAIFRERYLAPSLTQRQCQLFDCALGKQAAAGPHGS